METPNWSKERANLRARFAAGDITIAKPKELEWYLVVLANSRWTTDMPGNQPLHKEETETYATIIRHLLMIRLGEELHAKSHKISVWALVVATGAAVFAAGAVLFAGLQWWADVHTSHATVLPASAVPNTSAQPPPPSASSTELRLPSPSTQSVPYIALTNSTPFPSTASTNR